MTAAAPASPPFSRHVLDLDAAATTAKLEAWLLQTIARDLHRRGAVVAISGGVDSAVCAALVRRTLGRDRVRTLFLPGQHTPPDARDRVHELCRALDLPLAEQSIVPALQALGCYDQRDAALRAVFPDYEPGQRYKITIAAGLLERDRASVFDVVRERRDGSQDRARLPLDAWLRLHAATNLKQRTRMLLLHHTAEVHNFAVVGTPNRLEYELGFFVRGGDGLADLEPIAHLYKTQVYALAAHLGVPESIRSAPPSTDTYSLPQTQQEFYFAVPHADLDLLLWAEHHAVPAATVAAVLQWTAAQVERARADLARKREAAARLHHAPRVPRDQP